MSIVNRNVVQIKNKSYCQSVRMSSNVERRIPFESLSRMHKNDMVVQIEFDSCDTSNLKCDMVKIVEQGIDSQPEDSIWCIYDISNTNYPKRYFRLFQGKKSLKNFLNHYGHMDDTLCVHHKSGKLGIGKLKSPTEVIPVSEEHILVNGVPQKSENSGICWFAATCYVLLTPPSIRNLLLSKLKPDIASLIKSVLVNPNAAEQFRARLYEEYGFGDNPKQNPYLDGKNGCTEFCSLAAQLDIPVARIFAPDMVLLENSVKDQFGNNFQLRDQPKNDEVGIIVVRCFRTRWIPQRRLKYKNRRYKLVSVFIGSEHCGHQIGASTCGERVCRWSVADSDGTRKGVGPMFWNIKRNPGETRTDFKNRWWTAFSSMIPVTIFSDGLCDFSPHNRPNKSLNAMMKKSRQEVNYDKPGVVNSDFVYVSLPET